MLDLNITVIYFTKRLQNTFKLPLRMQHTHEGQYAH